jgi:YVTN family beta-propeller protein
MKSYSRFLTLPAALALPLFGASVRIIQTNAAGDEVHVIDPATNKVEMTYKGMEAPHGVVPSPGGKRVYFTVEGDSTVTAVDSKTGKILGKAPLSGHPNNISISKDGKYVFAGIAVAPGAVEVIDTGSMKTVKLLPTKGAVHNVYVTPDGKNVVAGSVGGKIIQVWDAQTFAPAWELAMDKGVRCMTFAKAADGSTSTLFVQLSDVNGFAVIDFKTHEVVKRVMLPEEYKGGVVHSGAPSHGIGVSPDGKLLCVNSSVAQGVFVYSMPDLKVLGFVKTGNTPDWLTFTPDSKMVYVAVAGMNEVSAVDLATRTEIARIPVGEVPKRNGTLVIQ